MGDTWVRGLSGEEWLDRDTGRKGIVNLGNVQRRVEFENIGYYTRYAVEAPFCAEARVTWITYVGLAIQFGLKGLHRRIVVDNTVDAHARYYEPIAHYIYQIIFFLHM